jgi:folylpolyglutamate synthase/dihydropteroate synthase
LSVELQQQMALIWKEFDKLATTSIHKRQQILVLRSLNETLSFILGLDARLHQQCQESTEIHVLITGSLYLVGGMLELLGYQIE